MMKILRRFTTLSAHSSQVRVEERSGMSLDGGLLDFLSKEESELVSAEADSAPAQ